MLQQGKYSNCCSKCISCYRGELVENRHHYIEQGGLTSLSKGHSFPRPMLNSITTVTRCFLVNSNDPRTQVLIKPLGQVQAEQLGLPEGETTFHECNFASFLTRTSNGAHDQEIPNPVCMNNRSYFSSTIHTFHFPSPLPHSLLEQQ